MYIVFEIENKGCPALNHLKLLDSTQNSNSSKYLFGSLSKKDSPGQPVMQKYNTLRIFEATEPQTVYIPLYLI